MILGACLVRRSKPGVFGNCGHQELSLVSVLNVRKTSWNNFLTCCGMLPVL